MTFSICLSLETKGFGFEGGDEGVATKGDLGCCLVGVAVTPIVVVDEDLIVFDGEESGDLDNEELTPLGNVSKEVESKRSFTSLVARTFLLIPFGTKGEEGVVASVAIKEATGCTTEGRDGDGSLLAVLK